MSHIMSTDREPGLAKGLSDIPPPDQSLLDGLRDLVITPYTLRRAFLLLARFHYSDPSHYGILSKKLKNFVWSQDENKRSLRIDLDYEYDPKKKDERPAIFVGCRDINYSRIVSDNQKSQSEDLASEEYVKDGDTAIIIRHIGGTPDEAFQLSDLSAQFFLGIRKIMIEHVKLKGYEVQSQLSSRPFERASEQADQQFICDLIIAIKFNAIWNVFRESQRLKTIGWGECHASFGLK